MTKKLLHTALTMLCTGCMLHGAEITTTMEPLTTKRPYLPRKQSGYAFNANIEQIAYIAPGMLSCLHFMPVNPSHNPELWIAVPPEIEIAGVFRWIDLNPAGNWKTPDGKDYRLYHAVPGPRAAKYTFVWQLNKPLPEGTPMTAYYWGTWSKGKQEPRKLAVEVVHLPEITGFQKLPVYWSMPGDFYAMLPTFDFIKKMGVNYIDIWTYLNPDESEWGSGNLAAIRPKARAAGLGEIGWIQEWWWHNGRKADDGAAVMTDGSRNTAQLCPSYRGEWYQKLLQQGRMLIDRGIVFHSTDPEMYSQGDKLCCCDRCTEAFRKDLAEKLPGKTFTTLAELAAHPESDREVFDLWRDFKCRQYASFFGDYRREMERYMTEKGLDPKDFRFMIYSSYHRSFPGMYEHENYKDSWTYNNGLEDPAHFIGIFDILAPMSYMEVYANYNPYDMLTTWKDTVVQRRITGDKIDVAPILSTGYPFAYAFDCDINAEMLKYELLEAMAGGARGFGFWGECPLDAKDMKSIAEVVGMLAPYEELLLTSRPEDWQNAADNAMVKVLASPRGRLVLVSEYSRDTRTVKVRIPEGCAGSIRDLQTGEMLPAAQDGTFETKLDSNRAKLFYIGKE